jgi:glycosyltransferase involved in cell wall biosynthesis
VLLLDHCTPEPDKDAGSAAVIQLIRILQHLGGKVTFVPEDNYLFLDPYTGNLQRMGVECLYAPFVTAIDDHLASAPGLYDVVLIYRYTAAERHLRSIRRFLPRARIALLEVDLHFLREAREAELRDDEALRRRAARIRRDELAVIRDVDYTMVHSTAERDLLARECPGAPVAVYGWVTDAPGTLVPFAPRRDIVFIGGYQHPPNVDAVLYFVREVLPLIRATLPDATFYIVGSNPPAELRALETDGVVVTGFVPDLRPLLDRARVAVAPLRFGAGVKGKIATAMSHGLPCVATSIGAEGMGLVDGRDVLVADTPADFATAVCRLYTNPDLWARLSSSGLEFVTCNFGFERGAAAVSHVLHQLNVLTPAPEGGQTRPPPAAAPRAPSEPWTRPGGAPVLPDGLHLARVSSLEEYRAHRAGLAREMDERARLEASLVPPDEAPFIVPGYCACCRTDVDFRVGFEYSLRGSDGIRVPNWREHLTCPCGLNCRMRAAFHVMTTVLHVREDEAIYTMEQATPLFRWLAARYPGVVGSEYLGDRVGLGHFWRGLRNEDATRLTFDDSTFDLILSFDVFEHMPDYPRAFEECWRCLRTGGRLLMTVPFVAGRATVSMRPGPSSTC